MTAGRGRAEMAKIIKAAKKAKPSVRKKTKPAAKTRSNPASPELTEFKVSSVEVAPVIIAPPLRH